MKANMTIVIFAFLFFVFMAIIQLDVWMDMQNDVNLWLTIAFMAIALIFLATFTAMLNTHLQREQLLKLLKS